MILKVITVSVLIPLLCISMLLHWMLKLNFVENLHYGRQSIQIKRDQFNIPTINAQSFKSAMYAWGYVLAEDRLFQLAFRRASIKGQLSKYLGVKAIDIDKMFRELNLYGWAVKTENRFRRQNATQFSYFQAYAQGINDYYKTTTFKSFQFYIIGLDWQDWTVADIFGVYKLLKWSLSFGMTQQYIRSMLLTNFTKEQVDKFLPYQSKYWLDGNQSLHTTIIKDHQLSSKFVKDPSHFNQKNFKPISVQKMSDVGYFQYLDMNQRASNSWVISGKHTASGHPILCNDPHLDSSLPGQWYQIKIFYTGKNGQQKYFMGGSTIGLPTIIGKTSYVSVTVTTNYIDSQDLFKQTIEGNKYLVDGEWRPLKVRKQIIQIKGGEKQQYQVYQTHRGPLIKHIGSKGYLYKIDQPLSLCWVGFTDAQFLSLSPYIHFPQIQTYQQLLTALKQYTDYGPPFNIIYSTKDDHIGYIAVGSVPLRTHPHVGMYIKDGSVSSNDWIGLIKGADKLHLQDPERGYIVSANNKAASGKYFNGVLDISIYTARATRIQNLIQNQIKAGRKITKQFMKQVQLDTVDSYCLWLVQGIKKKLNQNTQKYKFVFSLFNNFHCNFSATSTTSSFYLTFLQNLYEELHPQGIQAISHFNLANFHHFYQYLYSFLLKQQHSHKQLQVLNASMFDGLRQLRTHFNSQISSKYQYGELHRDHMIHRPFSFGKYFKSLFEYEGPGVGNINTPNVAYMARFHEKDYRTNHRANIRIITSYYEDSQWIIDGGSSQKFYSKHYRDQTQSFMEGKYLIMDPWNRTNAVI